MDFQQLLDNAHQALNKGEVAHALFICRQAVELEPNNATAQSNLSYLAYLNGDLPQALLAGASAVELHPGSVDARINFANALRTNGEPEAALDQLEASLQFHNQSAIAWTQLNLVYQDLGRPFDAIRAGTTAIGLDNSMPHAYSNLALSYQQLGMVQKADSLLKKALEFSPSADFLHKNHLMNLQYLPLASSEEMRTAALGYGALAPAPVSQIERRSHSDSTPLRVGFVSGDFRQHPVGIFLAAVLAGFHPENIRTTLYASQHIEDELTEKLKSNCHNWTNIQKLDDRAATQLIRDDHVDILIDLSGHTGGSRLNIFSYRAAPIQISWLGYFASTGVAEMDYVLMGEAQVVEGTQSYFSEKLVVLPGSQFCYTPPLNAPTALCSPLEKNGFITFGCFNNTAKLNTDVIRTWARILHEVENSQLILKWSIFDDQEAKNYFWNQFRQYNISADRIELRGKSTHPEMMDEYNDIDIALDPFPFSGALTSCEALWMGVPVITMPRIRPVSRQTAGILSQLGKTELIAENVHQYINIARMLAADKNHIAQYKTELRGAMADSALTNGMKMARELEKVFLSLHNTIDTVLLATSDTPSNSRQS